MIIKSPTRGFLVNFIFNKRQYFIVFFISLFILIGVNVSLQIIKHKDSYDKGVVLNYAKGLISKPKKINIDIKFEDYQKLTYLRERALEQGFIFTEDDSYIPAMIHSEGQDLRADIRLKGDIINHIEGDKWSLRVKIKDGEVLDGMSVFSLQDPKMSGYISEWLLHNLLRYEGLMALRYEYVELIINGKNMGIYALEESFSKELIEFNERRVGPILKFDESGIWDYVSGVSIDEPDTFIEKQGGLFLDAEVDMFQTNKVIADPVLYKNYLRGKDLLEGFRQGKKKASEVFDIDSAAKSYALSVVTGSEHSLRWKNVRFYYNPITDRLEIIAYNAYNSGIGFIDGIFWKDDYMSVYFLPGYQNLFFSEPLFQEKYIHYLKHYSQSDRLDDFVVFIEDDLKKNLGIIYKDDPRFHYSFDVMQANQKFVRDNIVFLQADKVNENILEATEYLDVNYVNREIVVKSGHWKIYESLVIPGGFEFIIKEGVTIDLNNGAYILSYSPLKFLGSKEKPIKIISSDKSGQGLVVLNANGESELNFVEFDNIRAINDDDWELSGAVTFYQSDIKVSNCTFNNNIKSDDFLNIIRASFKIEDTIFVNSEADAIDVDFGNGEIINGQFLNSGNDGLDFSGSVVNLYNIDIQNSGDKAISAGEKSELALEGVSIDNAKIGIASKDQSKIVGKDINISNAEYALVVYQKKNVFGPASMFLENFNFDNVKEIYRLEKKSILILNSKEYVGEWIDVFENIYEKNL